MAQDEKDRISYMISVMQAFADGKKIECIRLDKCKDWIVALEPAWDWSCYDYRVIPELKKPQYRPFESAEEVTQAIKEHGTYLTTDLEYGNRIQILEFNDHNIWCGAGAKVSPLHYCFEKHFMFCDGTPFGKLITE